MVLRQLENEIKKEYIDQEVDKRKKIVTEANNKIKFIMKSWIGLSIDDAFRGWQRCVKETKHKNRTEQKGYLRKERLRYEDGVAKYELEKIDVSRCGFQ